MHSGPAQCPRCGYRRRPSDGHVVAGVCPACGIAYDKWLGRHRRRGSAGESPGIHRPPDSLLTRVPERTEPLAFWGRVVLFAVLVVWGAWFMVGGLDWRAIGGSFMHKVNLPFHELGHLLFSPFGEFLTLLGGSLFQVMVPLILLAAFVIGRNDNFAGAVMLWWAGQSLIDLSPYIADAPYRAIPLIFGLGEEYHDWGNLLEMMDMTGHARAIAGASFGLGSVLMTTSFLWGGYVLYLQRQRLP